MSMLKLFQLFSRIIFKKLNGGKDIKRKHHNDISINEEMSLRMSILCYLSYLTLIIFGYLRDFLRKIGIEKTKSGVECNRNEYVPLYHNFENFMSRNIYRRGGDILMHPIKSKPGPIVDVMHRVSDDNNWTFKCSGTSSKVINLVSYNYLGFAECEGYHIEKVEKTIQEYGVGVCTSAHEIGNLEIVRELEIEAAKFLGVESSIVFGMGFFTNAGNIPALAEKGCLIISDELNHASLILGCKTSGATIEQFHHNDMNDLELKIRNAIVNGQPKTHRPWRKIIIIVEGIYSMEGTIVNLPEIIRIKKKYKCYVYLDEAHSIGAFGATGRGVVEYYGCNAKDIDLLMGTFSKSFGAVGGYIAGRKEIIDHIRIYSINALYATSMSSVIAQQVIGVFRIISNENGRSDGKLRIERLRRNTKYFRSKLKRIGLLVYGHDDSPVVPIIIGFPASTLIFIRYGFKMGIGMCGAGFPATSLETTRVRLCISAAHTKEMLDKAIEILDIIGDRVSAKYLHPETSTEEIIY